MNPSPPTQVVSRGSPDAIQIRPLQVADASAYVDLLNELDRETDFLLWEPGERTIEADDVQRELTSSKGTEKLRLVATSDSRLVGFLVSHRGQLNRTRHRADFAMAVLVGHQRRSIGTRLLHELEVWATDNGIERIELTVMSHNQKARALYEQHGFRLEGTKPDAIRVAGEPIDECVMGKLLTPTKRPIGD